MKRLILSTLLAATIAAPMLAQTPISTARVSQHSTILQRIGLTDITVDYHRPAVNGREVWGTLVPLDQVWRAGANENTTVTFSTAVSVEGQEVPAGTYGVHMIPTQGDWTVILSSMSDAWGSFSYDESEDVVRVTVTPQEHMATERLTYSFDSPDTSSVDLALTWEEKRVPIHLEVDLATTLVAQAAEDLRSLPRFSWQGWNQAAGVAVQVGNFEQATTWVDRSISMNRSFANLQTKAQILENAGESSEEIMAEAMGIATEVELNAYGYRIFFQGQVEEALVIFTENAGRHPESWNVHDSLAEAQAAHGLTDQAIVNYEKAHEMTTLDAQKTRIEGVIEGLRAAD